MNKKTFMLMNTKKLKTSLIAPALGMILIGNARAQIGEHNVSAPVADRITKSVAWGSTFGASVAQGSMKIVPGDGFIKVEYVMNYPTMDGEIIQMPRRELYSPNGNILEVVGTIAVAQDIKRIKTFPKKLAKHLSGYVVLGIEMEESVGGYTMYNAYDKEYNLVGYAYSSLEELKANVSKAVANNNKLMKHKMSHTR